MDYLDIIQGRYYQTQGAKYYRQLPIPETGAAQSPEAIPQPFEYEAVDPTEWHYRQLLQNLIDKEAATYTIKTKTRLVWRVGGYVVTMSGRLYKIISVTEDVSATSRQARRLFAVPVGTEYVIRLSEIENPWGIS